MLFPRKKENCFFKKPRKIKGHKRNIPSVEIDFKGIQKNVSLNDTMNMFAQMNYKLSREYKFDPHFMAAKQIVEQIEMMSKIDTVICLAAFDLTDMMNLIKPEQMKLMACGSAKKIFESEKGWENGAYWYYIKGEAFGFSPNMKIKIKSYDMEMEEAEKRLSWSLEGKGKYRVGTVFDLKESAIWVTKIYVFEHYEEIDNFVFPIKGIKTKLGGIDIMPILAKYSYSVLQDFQYNETFNNVTTEDLFDQARRYIKPDSLLCIATYDMNYINRNPGANLMELFACGRAEKLLQHTYSKTRARKENDAYWYYVKGVAFGVSPTKKINLAAPGDIESNQGDKRISWNLNGMGGYRAGNFRNLENDTRWTKGMMILNKT